jgi:hypothetical protein
MTQDIPMDKIEALAMELAERNGELCRFVREKAGICEMFGSTSTYERYLIEAEETCRSH